MTAAPAARLQETGYHWHLLCSRRPDVRLVAMIAVRDSPTQMPVDAPMLVALADGLCDTGAPAE